MTVIRANIHNIPFHVVSKPKVFVCHASEDAEIAAQVVDELLNDGFPVWLDKLCILPGQDSEQIISQGVDSAHAIVVLISKHSVDKTGFLQQEVRLALAQADRRPEGAIFILPLLLDKTLPPPSFKRWQWVSMGSPAWFDDISSALRLNITRSISGNFHNLDEDPWVPSVLLSRARRSSDGMVDFIIDLKVGDNRPVWLGASVISPNGHEQYDEKLDRQVTLRSGVAAYRRKLPSPHQKNDRVVLALWSPNIPRSDDDDDECLDRFEFTL